MIKNLHIQSHNQKSVKPVNYSLDSQKISFDFLKSHLWSAADILRGSLDSSEYRQPVMTLLFLKRLNDTFEENAVLENARNFFFQASRQSTLDKSLK
jgi:type I restriction-modification system DNA methylase subunit